MMGPQPADQRRKELGAWGEEVAAQLLAAAGFQLLARNYRLDRRGEIDLILRRGDCVYAFEVKTRSAQSPDRESLMGPRQLRNIKGCLEHYMETQGLELLERAYYVLELYCNAGGALEHYQLTAF